VKRNGSHHRRPSVAILIESSRGYGRELLLGVANYIRDHSPWFVYRQEQKLVDEFPRWLKSWRGEGIITRLENPKAVQFIRRLGIPVVQLHDVPPDRKCPSVSTDNDAVARMAFEHLRERGFRRFAFSGFTGANYSDSRRRAFVRLVEKQGWHCHVYQNSWELELDRIPGSGYFGLKTVAAGCFGTKNRERAAGWIKELPKPIGLLTCDDIHGQQMLDACFTAGVTVPKEVAVIGVNNDEVLCEFSHPSLTSVVPNARRIGYEAAALLDRMMAGEQPPSVPVQVDPKGVASRRSTEVFSIEDRPLANAIRFIEERPCKELDVKSLAKAAALPRSTLERRFARVLGHSPKVEIQRVRLNHARQLLAETDLPLDLIAKKIGFEHAEYLRRIFKKKTGLTPLAFRFRVRGGG
jgi:LacI family transcriptional regulator, galactose operon repressor